MGKNSNRPCGQFAALQASSEMDSLAAAGPRGKPLGLLNFASIETPENPRQPGSVQRAHIPIRG
jgi:hypothetical protein